MTKHVLLGILFLAACESTPTAPRATGAYDDCQSATMAVVNAARARGDRGAEVEALRTLVEECPNYAPGHRDYVKAARSLGGDAQREMESFYTARADAPQSPIGPYVKALLDDEASTKTEFLEAAVARDASFHFAYVELGAVWAGADRPQQALDYYRKAVSSKRDDPDANLGLAQVLEKLGVNDEARRHYRNYIELRPGDRSAKKAYSNLLVYSLKDGETARTVLEGLLRDDPDDVEVIMTLAAAEWLTGQRDAAAARYHAVLERDPRNARAALNLGNLFYRVFDLPEAQARQQWPKARAAYLYFLRLDRAEDLQDLVGLTVNVPARIADIDKLLGPLPDGYVPKLSDF